MNYLLREYFDRDLSLDELDRLEALLEGPEENAGRFAEYAAVFCASLGILHPPKVRRLPRFRWRWSGALILTATVAAALLWRIRQQPPLPPAQPPVVMATPATIAVRPSVPSSKPSPAREAVPSAPASVQAPRPRMSATVQTRPVPNPWPTEQIFDGLWLSIVMPEEGIVTLRVLDPRGHVLRNLFAGVMDAGMNRLQWDGLDDRGRQVEPGEYTVEVWQGGYRRNVNVVLKRSGTR